MRKMNSTPIVPSNVATRGHLAYDLVELARVDLNLFRQRTEITECAVRITGADAVLADLRRQLDDLAEVDPARVSVALAATLANLTTPAEH